MKLELAIITAVLFCVVLCALPAHAVISSSVYSNGGSIIINTDESLETSNNLMRFGTTNDSYQYGGKSQTILTLGRSGIQKTDSTKVETLGMLNAFDTAGMFSTQTNVPETICDENGYLISNGTDSSRYPETQTVEGMWGTMASGPGTSYESQIVVDETLVAASVVGTSPNGYLFEDVKGSIKSGLDKNQSLLQRSYSRHDHALVRLDEAEDPSGAIDWLWDTTTEEIVNESANETVNETVEEAQP